MDDFSEIRIIPKEVNRDTSGERRICRSCGKSYLTSSVTEEFRVDDSEDIVCCLQCTRTISNMRIRSCLDVLLCEFSLKSVLTGLARFLDDGILHVQNTDKEGADKRINIAMLNEAKILLQRAVEVIGKVKREVK